MAYPSQTLSFEDRISVHLQEIDKIVNSQAWQRAPVLDWLLKNAKPYSGGEYMTELIEDNYTPTGDAFGEGSTLPVVQKNILISAMYQPVQVQESCFLDEIRKQKIMTSGDMGPVVQWVTEQTASTARMLRENMATYTTAATTGTAADGSSRPTSIFDIIKATGTIGNVSPTDASYWAAQVDTTSGAWTSTGLSRFRTQLRKARRYTGFSGPDALFCSGTTHDAVLSGGTAKTTYMREPAKGASSGPDVGDGAWNWSAKAPYDPNFFIDDIPCWYDPHLDALEASALSTGGVLVGINSKAVFLRENPNMKFTLQPFRYSEQRLASYTRDLWMGQTVAKNRSSNLLLTNIL